MPEQEIIQPEFGGARITVRLEPPGKLFSCPRRKTARQLLESFGLAEEEAIVARGDELLTPDRRIWPNDTLLVRVVGSRG